MLYSLTGIAPTAVRGEETTARDKLKLETDPRHLIYGQSAVTKRLQSRKIFLNIAPAADYNPGWQM